MAKRTTDADGDGPNPAVRACLDAFYAAYVRRFNPPEVAELWLTGHPGAEWRRAKKAGLLPVPIEQVTLPLISGGKDAALVKRMVEAWGEAKVRWLIEEMFVWARTDPRVVRSDHDVAALYYLAQHLMTRQQRTADMRTAANLDAAERAMRRIG
jgi:hypothetical protein